MSALGTVFRREFRAYFATPLALVFIVIFLVATGVFTFYLGRFFDRGQADLQPFFAYHPWLYLFLVPAVAMRLWAEERRAGTLELLMTLPLPPRAIVVGKFLAAWAFIAVALALTAPLWITVNWLGDPDNGVILASYVGSLAMAGGFLAIGCAMSAVTRNQVVAFVLSVAVCFIFTVSGLDIVQAGLEGWMPDGLISAIAGLSFLNRFSSISQGVVDLRDVIYFATLIGSWLLLNLIFVERAREAG